MRNGNFGNTKTIADSSDELPHSSSSPEIHDRLFFGIQ